MASSTSLKNNEESYNKRKIPTPGILGGIRPEARTLEGSLGGKAFGVWLAKLTWYGTDLWSHRSRYTVRVLPN